MVNQIRHYAWGSRYDIAAIQGRPTPSAGPEAELWLGAHPQAPSELVRPDGVVPLTEALAAAPDRMLGPRVLAEFGPRLPYLLKLLAADRPLSIQAHPDADQARAGFAAQAGIPPEAWRYTDPYAKPELLVAVDPFEALCGFRDPATSAEVLGAFRLAGLAPLVGALRLTDPEQALRSAVHEIMALSAPVAAELVGAVAAIGGSGPSGDRYAASRALASRLAHAYPGDPGVLLALLLNQVWLGPGEAVWMPAGHLHAYLRGVGVEIMAASDNVLRGGLTSKPVDVAELTRILRYEVLTDPVWRPREIGPGLVGYAPPAREFALVRAVPVGDRSAVLPGTGPRIVLCVRGGADLHAGDQVIHICGGGSVFLCAGEPSVTVVPDPDGVTVFQALTAAGLEGIG
jgi:mannose-6-phosphate isomerase